MVPLADQHAPVERQRTAPLIFLESVGGRRLESRFQDLSVSESEFQIARDLQTLGISKRQSLEPLEPLDFQHLGASKFQAARTTDFHNFNVSEFWSLKLLQSRILIISAFQK